MRVAALLKVLQDPAVKLPHVFEALTLQERRGFLTADTAGAEGHHLRVLHLRRQFGDRRWKVAERINTRHYCALERAQLHLVVVTGVIKNDRATFIEPLLEHLRIQARRGVLGRLNSLHPKRNDLFLDAHQHATKGLLSALAVLRLEAFQSGNGMQHGDQRIHVLADASDEHIDALGTQQDRPLELIGFALLQETLPQHLEIGEFSELVAGDVGDRVRGHA